MTESERSSLDRELASWFQRNFDACVTWVYIVLMAGLFVTAYKVDAVQPLWADEIITYYMSEQPAIPDIFAAISDGVDGQPPLYDLVVRVLRPRQLIPHRRLRVRLPSTIGLFVMAACVFVFVRRRLPAIFAMFAGLLALQLTWPYASEGRSYGIMLGCIGVALVCWQMSTADSRARIPIAIAISLTAAIAFHYFSILVIGAFLAGEAVRWWKVKKIDFRMLAALTVPVLVLIPHASMIRGGQAQVKNFWSKAQTATLYEYYLPSIYQMRPLLLVALICCAGVGLVILWYFFFRPGRLSPNKLRMRTEEWVVALSLVLLPLVGILGLLLTVKMFVPRYFLWAMIGMGISVPVLLHRLILGSRIVATVLVFPLLYWSVNTIKDTVPSSDLRFTGGFFEEIRSVPSDPRPIVVPHIHFFMEMWLYSNDDVKKRLVYLVDPELEFRYKLSDTSSLIMAALGRHVPIGVQEYESFIQANPRFFVAGDGGGDWIVPHLRESKFEMVPVKGAPSFYHTQAP